MTQAAAGVGQKLAEMVTVAALLTQVIAQFRARRGDRAENGAALDEAEQSAARSRFAPALHREWLADAALRDVAGAWGAALPYENTDASARQALDACEARLRELHPYAMRAYDQLRANGQPRAEAMRQTVPKFLMHPDPRTAPRDAFQGRYLPSAAAPGPGDPMAAPPDPDAAAAARLLGIIGRMNEVSVTAGRGPLSPEVVEMALSGRTNAPTALITRIVDGLRAGTIVVPAPSAGAGRRTVAAAGPGAADWPRPVHDGVAVTVLRQAAGAQPRGPARAAHRAPAAGKAPHLRP